MIAWITRALAVALHDRQLAEHGGGAGVRDEALLESALGRPQQLRVYADPPPDLAALAASLAFGLAHNPPFVDGNKRTAIVSCEVFVRLNDASLQASNIELYPVVLHLAEGLMNETEFADWLRLRLVSRAKNNHVNEPRGKYRAKA